MNLLLGRSSDFTFLLSLFRLIGIGIIWLSQRFSSGDISIFQLSLYVLIGAELATSASRTLGSLLLGLLDFLVVLLVPRSPL